MLSCVLGTLRPRRQEGRTGTLERAKGLGLGKVPSSNPRIKFSSQPCLFFYWPINTFFKDDGGKAHDTEGLESARSGIVLYSQYRVFAQELLVAVGCSAAAAAPRRVVSLRFVLPLRVIP